MELNTDIAPPNIILFDDDEANLRLYSNYFRHHFNVKCFQNPYHYQQALNDDVSAILIDVLMPVMDGIMLYEELMKHKNYNGCPLIFMSASGSEDVLQSALRCGGQDFLSRTMTKDEMILRVKNKIDYFKSNRQIFGLGNVKINTTDLRACYRGEMVELTLTEMKIMKFLIREYPQLSTREEINQEVWPGQKVMPSTLNTHLSNLRNKFPDWEYEILNIKGKGIQLVPKTSPSLN